MNRATVVAIGVIALVAAIAAGVVPAVVTGGGSEQPAISPVRPNDVDGGQDQPTPPADGGDAATPVVFRELEPFSSCEAFLEHAQGRAIGLVGPWGLPQYGTVIGGLARDEVAVFAEAPLAEASDAAAPVPAGEPSLSAADDVARAAESAGGLSGGFSGTNVQEAGIDEPDIVKTERQADVRRRARSACTSSMQPRRSRACSTRSPWTAGISGCCSRAITCS